MLVKRLLRGSATATGRTGMRLNECAQGALEKPPDAP